MDTRTTARGEAPGTDEVVRYYDRIAGKYEADRFDNSYGRYVDAQKRRVLRRWLAPVRGGKILDLACGTGRFLEMATHGLDASTEMVQIARRAHPDKSIRCGLASNMAAFGIQFDAIFCLHFFMRLRPEEIADMVRSCFEQLRPGGVFIFDIPSKLRRKFTGFRPEGWHAATAVDITVGKPWKLEGALSRQFLP